jgi:spore maturation protein CgeB
MHTRRVSLLEALARHQPLEVWAPSVDHLAPNSPLRNHYHGPVWGFDNYAVLARSAMTLNVQIDNAGDFADNIRLYEATGLGAMLITDAKRNLASIFEPGKEVVAYEGIEDCIKLVEHFSTHAAERAAIAAAGQERTLKHHTYYQRMQNLVDQLLETVDERLTARQTATA